MRWILVFGLLANVMIVNTSSASSGPSCTAKTGQRHCFAKVVSDVSGHPLVSTLPSGYGPADWRLAYGAPGGQTSRVAIIVAYGDPSLAQDMATYSAAFGVHALPMCTSFTQSACLDAITQNGSLGAGGQNAGWATETALDAETIHGICPRCRLEVVSAYSASTSDLLAAIERAKIAGAKVISMSWGGSEFSAESTLDQAFSSSQTFIASSGDSGYGTSWPAAAASVIAVGGTSLTFSGGAVHEIGWSGSGSGCSRYESKPAWQADTGCAKRSVADISADADPATGAAVYHGAWYRVGGTSLAAPIIAGYAASHGGLAVSKIYTLSGQLRDIAFGTNGSCSRVRQYLCNAGNGYDGPTGAGVLSTRFAW